MERQMSYTSLPRVTAPYAIAFSIEELLLVRSWAQQRDLALAVATDQVLNGAEFEEMLIVSPQSRDRRTLTIWRTQTAVFAQTPQSKPRAFDSMRELLAALRPARKRHTTWLRLLRRVSFGANAA